MKQLLPFFLAFIFIACSPSSNSNNSQQDSTATSTSTSIETTADAQSNTASSPDLQNEATFNALLATRINRDPEQSLPANDAEQQCVTQYDQTFFKKRMKLLLSLAIALRFNVFYKKSESLQSLEFE